MKLFIARIFLLKTNYKKYVKHSQIVFQYLLFLAHFFCIFYSFTMVFLIPLLVLVKFGGILFNIRT